MAKNITNKLIILAGAGLITISFGLGVYFNRNSPKPSESSYSQLKTIPHVIKKKSPVKTIKINSPINNNREIGEKIYPDNPEFNPYKNEKFNPY